jgi:thiamine transport system ATP-binding protein
MLELDKLSLRRDGAIFEYSLSCAPGEVVALLGPSGGGKSTLLDLIAGFEQGDGVLTWQQHSLLGRPVAQRPVTTLFQQHNLFEHLTLAQNIALAYVGRVKLHEAERVEVEAVAQSLSIQSLLDKRPGELSGGQQQRGALARALLRQRPVLLLDEPFSALDPVLRCECLDLVRELAKQWQLAVLLVSHQLSDAKRIADRIAFIEQGRVAQFDAPDDLIHAPATLGIAAYLKACA